MSEVKVIGIGNDHAAVDLKNEIKAYLEEKGYKVVNYGTDSSESCDYPIYGAKVGNAVASGEVDAGVLICGTGIGISIAANKVNGVRAAVVSEPVSARLTKEHNNANIIAFGARIVGSEMAKAIVDAWLDAEYIGSGRHERRVNMIEEEAAKYNKQKDILILFQSVFEEVVFEHALRFLSPFSKKTPPIRDTTEKVLQVRRMSQRRKNL